MSIKPYLYFNGNCREALEYYAEVFKTEKPRLMLYGDMPSNEKFPMDEEAKKRVLHAEIKIKENTLMFSDSFPGTDLVMGGNIELVYMSGDMEEVKYIFSKLKEEGKVAMELQETFWSKCYGTLTDKYGIGWQISYEDK